MEKQRGIGRSVAQNEDVDQLAHRSLWEAQAGFGRGYYRYYFQGLVLLFFESVCACLSRIANGRDFANINQDKGL